MTTLFKQLLARCGWTFVPSHDRIKPSGIVEAVPESFIHDDYDTIYSLEEMIDQLNKQIYATTTKENSTGSTH